MRKLKAEMIEGDGVHLFFPFVELCDETRVLGTKTLLCKSLLVMGMSWLKCLMSVLLITDEFLSQLMRVESVRVNLGDIHNVGV